MRARKWSWSRARSTDWAILLCKNVCLENVLCNLIDFCDEAHRKIKEEFPCHLWVFNHWTECHKQVNGHREKSLHKRIFCDSSERFTQVKANQSEQLSPRCGLAMWALGRREQFGYFTLSHPPAARLCQPSSWKGASVVPVCDVSAMFLHRLVVRLPQFPAATSCPELRFPSWKRVH